MTEARRGNGFDPTVTKRFVGEIDRHLNTLDSYTGEHMERCKSVRELITECYDRAKDSGIPKKELKAVVKARVLERKAKKVRDDLDDMERMETFDQIRLALGDLSDLPLGQAARAEAGDPEADPDKTAANANAKALRGGLKEMSEKGKAKARSGKNGRKDKPEAEAAPAEGEVAGDGEEDVRPAFLRRSDETLEPVH